MIDFELLGSVVQKLHGQFESYFYLLLPVFFSVALAMTWFRGPESGGDFVEILRRAVVATFLMVGFREISGAILMITKEMAGSIDDMAGIEAVVRMAGEKAQEYTASPISALIAFNDLLLAGLAFISFLLLYLVHYVTMATYHFGWAFLSLIAPLMLAFHVFTPRLTLSLFRSLAEIACWRVAWSILSAMLAALPFGNAYQVGSDYLTVAIMNLVIAFAMISVPLVVHAVIGGGFSLAAAGLSGAAAGFLAKAPLKVARLAPKDPRSSGSNK